MSCRACAAITFVHKEGRIYHRVDEDLGFTGRVQGMDQKEAVGKLTKPVDNPRIDCRSSWRFSKRARRDSESLAQISLAVLDAGGQRSKDIVIIDKERKLNQAHFGYSDRTK